MSIQAIAQASKLLLIHHADGIMVVEHPGVFRLRQLHDVVLDVEVACRQAIRLHDILRTIVRLHGDKIRTLAIEHLVARAATSI